MGFDESAARIPNLEARGGFRQLAAPEGLALGAGACGFALAMPAPPAVAERETFVRDRIRDRLEPRRHPHHRERLTEQHVIARDGRLPGRMPPCRRTFVFEQRPQMSRRLVPFGHTVPEPLLEALHARVVHDEPFGAALIADAAGAIHPHHAFAEVGSHGPYKPAVVLEVAQGGADVLHGSAGRGQLGDRAGGAEVAQRMSGAQCVAPKPMHAAAVYDRLH